MTEQRLHITEIRAGFDGVDRDGAPRVPEPDRLRPTVCARDVQWLGANETDAASLDGDHVLHSPSYLIMAPTGSATNLLTESATAYVPAAGTTPSTADL